LRRTGGSASAVTVRAPKARHGRREVRLVWALADPYVNRVAGTQGEAGAPWPHLRQVCRVERRRTVRRRGQVRTEREVTYAVTSWTAADADAAALLRGLRGHWGIENRLHWVRDVTFDEDRSQTRTGSAPQVMAACRNLALSLLRRQGHTNIAAAVRTYAGRPPAAVALLVGLESG
jgi:predicted transposase YbfD/YdcC